MDGVIVIQFDIFFTVALRRKRLVFIIEWEESIRETGKPGFMTPDGQSRNP